MIGRLHKNSDILRVIRGGRRIRTPYVLLYIKPSPADVKHVRVACVVGKKVDKSAVVRHKYQRWLRELVHNLASDMSSCDMVWLALPPIKNTSGLDELKKSLEPVLKNIKN